MATRPRDADLVTILGSLTGIAVIVAGSFYLIGIFTTCAELRHAGVSVRDTVAMLPLEQLLSRGVSLVLYVLAFIAAAAVLLAFGALVEARFKRDVKGDLEAFAEHVPEGEGRDNWLRDARAKTEKTDWPDLVELLKTAASTATEPGRTQIVHRRRQASRVNMVFNVLYVALMIGALFLQPVFAIAAAVILGLWVGMGARPLVQQLAVASAVFFVAFMLSPWVTPRPLPVATINTNTIGEVSGDLLFIQDGRWYITAPGRALRIVEPDHVKSAKIDYSKRRRLVIEIIVDWFDDDRSAS